MEKKKVVFVGLSGGVDSATSAALLKKQHYDIVGVFLRTWHPDFLECTEEDERRDAIRIAAHLDIPFLTIDLSEIYKKSVADYMIDEYKIGRTPNPDVMCNKEIKFGAFLKRAIEMGADFIATGHYARIKNNFHSLLKGVDPTKDQSYFLWTLQQEQLSKIIFPIGHLKKTDVRLLAKKFSLPVSEKKDSQGICFLGKFDLKEFLKHYIKEKPGNVLLPDGRIIGKHMGTSFYTLGERHGFLIIQKKPNDKPYYIVAKDIQKNTLIVSQDPKEYSKININICKKFVLEKTNWIINPEVNKKYNAQIRYHGELLECKISAIASENTEVVFMQPILVASGQSCVIYENDIVLGGGIIK